MRRLLVFGLIFSLSDASMAFAAESLLESAKRITQQHVQAQPAPPANAVTLSRIRTDRPKTASYMEQGQEPRGLENSGMSKTKKLLIGLGIAAGFVGIAYAIDHSVEDSTPHSLGQR